jgi:hypothetical protein
MAQPLVRVPCPHCDSDAYCFPAGDPDEAAIAEDICNECDNCGIQGRLAIDGDEVTFLIAAGAECDFEDCEECRAEK